MAIALLDEELNTLTTIYPTVHTVIMPESAWNGTALTSVTSLAITNQSVTNLIIGGFAQQLHGYFNRLYCFTNGHLTYYYDKRHAVPLTERKTSLSYDLSDFLFFKTSPPITPSIMPKSPLMLPLIGALIPYICSELFCNTIPDDQFEYPILCLVNDWWFRMPHFQKLMALAARLQAIRWHRPILYISFHYAQFFDAFGSAAPIATTPVYRYIR